MLVSHSLASAQTTCGRELLPQGSCGSSGGGTCGDGERGGKEVGGAKSPFLPGRCRNKGGRGAPHKCDENRDPFEDKTEKKNTRAGGCSEQLKSSKS